MDIDSGFKSHDGSTHPAFPMRYSYVYPDGRGERVETTIHPNVALLKESGVRQPPC